MAITLLTDQPIESTEIQFVSKLRKSESEVEFTVEPSLNSVQFGSGTLYIHEDFLGFYSYETNNGFKIDYRRVVLHAIALDEPSDRKVIYVQLDTHFEELNSEEDNEDGYDSFTEVRFLLTDPYSAEGVYSAISTCQFLNPDFLGAGSEEEESDDGVYEDAEEEEGNSESLDQDGLSAQGRAIAETNISLLERALERGLADSNYPFPSGNSHDDDSEDSPDQTTLPHHPSLPNGI